MHAPGMNEGHGPDVLIEGSRLLVDAFFKVEEVTLRHRKFDGDLSGEKRILVLRRGDAAAVLIYNVDTDRVILVEQFKYPAHEHGDGWIIETVAGMVDPGEEPEAAARREALEETGYRLEHVAPIGTFYVSPGGSSERVFLYYAEVGNAARVRPGGGEAAEGEDIRLREFTSDELESALERGVLKDAKTVVAAMWFRDRGPRRRSRP